MGFLRACLKRLGSSQSANHQRGHSDVNHGFTPLRKDFIVRASPSTLGEPGKGAFHHPAPWQNDKAFLLIAAKHRLQTKLTMEQDPFQQLTAIGPVDPDEAQFLAGSSQMLEQKLGSGRIGNGCRGDDDHEEQAKRVHQDMTPGLFGLPVLPRKRAKQQLQSLVRMSTKVAHLRSHIGHL